MSIAHHISIVAPVVMLFGFLAFRTMKGHQWAERHRLHVQLLVLSCCLAVAAFKFYHIRSTVGLVAVAMGTVATVKFGWDSRDRKKGS